MAFSLFFLGFLYLFQTITALQVTPDSPCSSVCVDSNDFDFSDPNSSNTRNKDIVCYDSEYQSSPAGQKFQRCLSCLQDSTFSKGSESDQLWFLYNMRYAVDFCIFGFPNATNVASTPCSTEKACGELEGALTGDLISSSSTQKADYAFCSANGSVMRSEEVQKCHACVSASDEQDFLANYVVALGAGCQQQPAHGAIVGLNDTVFSTQVIGAVDPSTSSHQDTSKLGTPVIIGIGVGSAIFVLLVAGLIFICCRRRRNRRVRLGDGARSGKINSREYPISPLSFHCQAHITPQESTFFKSPSEVTIEESKRLPSPIEFTHTIHHTPILEADAFQKPNYGGWQPQIPKSRTLSGSPDLHKVPLRNITTTTTTEGPTVPGNVHHHAWSPQRTRFSPVDEIISPQSTTSTKSTTALLPLKPYNPAEWLSSRVPGGADGIGASPIMSTPTSATTASPVLGRTWGDLPQRGAYNPSQSKPQQQQPRPQQEQQMKREPQPALKAQLPTQGPQAQPKKKQAWADLPPRNAVGASTNITNTTTDAGAPPARSRQNTSSSKSRNSSRDNNNNNSSSSNISNKRGTNTVTFEKASIAVTVARTAPAPSSSSAAVSAAAAAAAAATAPPPSSKRRGNAHSTTRTNGTRNSPVETSKINTVFPGPPRR